MSEVQKYIDDNLERFRAELFDFLRIPSVSARREHDADTRRAADWLAARMKDAGLDVRIETTPGQPVVVGEWRGAGADAPTVLIYGHYDVQPVEPLELWSSPPFEPEVRDGRIYGRGSVDDKGQLYVHVKALEAHLKTTGRLPVNVIVVAEGEEEVGSENLMPFIEANAASLAADYVVISDTTMFSESQPSIGASLRGLAYFEIHVQGPAQDLHSGSYGGAVLNPATALAHIIASFHDENWHVTIPGFYDDVDAAGKFRDEIRALPFDEAGFIKETGSPELTGEAGFSTFERLWIRPTLEVNGLLSGYTGEGAKTVLPAKAMAKVSCRLVPNQDPNRIVEMMQAYVQRVAPAGVTVRVDYLHGGYPWKANVNGKLYDAGAAAIEEAFGKAPVFAGEGGSIPIVVDFERVLKAPVLLMGLGLPGENAPAPDEWMAVENFDRGTKAAAALLTRLG